MLILFDFDKLYIALYDYDIFMWLWYLHSGVGRRQNSLLNYYDVFSYPSLVVILNKNVRNEHYDENL